MKIKLLMLAAFLFPATVIFAQIYDPIITIPDNPVTYSMHLCTDGKFYYLINGGVAKDGKISIVKVDGEFVKSYPLAQDMRSIMYSKKDKSLYINIKGKDIYKLVDIANGTIQLVHSGIYENDQTTLAMDPNGKYFYALDNGILTISSVKTGEKVKQLSGLKCGSRGMQGSTTVAVDKKYLYTWDAANKTVYAYTKKGVFKKSFILKYGNLGHSLSAAYGLIFVSESDLGKPSTWYGYKLPVK